MADLALTCPKCKQPVSIPIEGDMTEYVCTSCGATNPLHDEFDTGFRDSLVGQLISDCEIQERVGDGRYGSVYRSFDRSLMRVVAFKVMLPSIAANPDFARRLHREAVTAAQLAHKNIVGMHRVGKDEKRDLHFLVMEFLEGRTIDTVVRETGPLPVDEAVDVFIQCADALSLAQSEGIIHRDLEPGNIMIDPAGVAKIMDFGLAKTVSQELQSMRVLDSPRFKSPEQLDGKTVDHRTDVYAFGATLYYALCGQSPHTGPTNADIIDSIFNREPRPIRELEPRVPVKIWEIVKRLIARQPRDRYQGFPEIHRDLVIYQLASSALRVTCPSCGSATFSGRVECRECGGGLALHCPSCGHEESVGTKFCGECGTPLGG